jgi:glycosyltransferase involved in cell wall biosynthesis
MDHQFSRSSSRAPRISVIIPAYNAARFLPSALESVLSQDHPSFEVIVVDDGSTDDTAAVLRPFAQRARIFHQPNNGVCAARNRGLAEAGGELVAFLDADDLFLPGKLTAQAAVFHRRRGLAMVQSGWQLVDAAGRYIRDIEPWRWARRLDLESWLLWKPVFPGAMMFHRDVVRSAGGFDETLRQAEDVDLVLRISAAGGTAAWLRQPTVQYRLHAENTIRDGHQQARDLTRVIDKLFDRPDLPRRLRRQEDRYRYYTLIWLAWQLHRTGDTDEVATYLRRSLVCRPHPPVSEAGAVGWLDYLAGHCRRDHRDITELRSLWPAFRQALALDGEAWPELQKTLELWLNVWHPLQVGDPAAAVDGLQACATDSLADFIASARPIARFSDHSSIRTVSQLRRLLSTFPSGLAGPGYLTAELYWAAFLEALQGRRLGKAVAGLWRGVIFGLHPRTWPCWVDYLRQVPDTLRNAGRHRSSGSDRMREQENPRG